MSYHYRNDDGRAASPGRIKLHVPKMTISPVRTSSRASNRSRSSSLGRDSNTDDDDESRGRVGRRIGAQFFGGNEIGVVPSRHSSRSFQGYNNEHLIMTVSQELDQRSSSRIFSTARLGDSFLSSSNLKTGILLEDNDISTSRTNSENWPEYRSASDRGRDMVPPPPNRFEDFRGFTGRIQTTYQDQPQIAKVITVGNVETPRYQEVPREKTNFLATKTPPQAASASASVEEDITYVTEQLQIIQETQDSILNSLRTDIDVVQAENTLLNQKNLQLQSQVSHLNQLVADLSLDLRQMRDLVRSKQALGVSLSLLHGRDNAYFQDPDINSMTVNYNSSSPSQNSTGNQTTPSIILSQPQTIPGQARFQTQTSHTSKSHSSKERHHRKSSHRPDTASHQIPLDSKTTSHTMKTKKRSKNGLKGKKSSNSKKSDTTNKLNGNSLYVDPPKSHGCFSKLFKSKKKDE